MDCAEELKLVEVSYTGMLSSFFSLSQVALQYDGLHLQTGMDSLNSSRNFSALESMKRGLYILENVSESRSKGRQRR